MKTDFKLGIYANEYAGQAIDNVLEIQRVEQMHDNLLFWLPCISNEWDGSECDFDYASQGSHPKMSHAN